MPEPPLLLAVVLRELVGSHHIDLFKWAYKLEPATPSDLVADCFELAADVRELDMQASPYDLAKLGYEPVRIESPEGRAEYVRRQAEFAERARSLRERLVFVCQSILGVTSLR